MTGNRTSVADPWITLAAIASVTERLRLGPMVSPLARRRPAKVAKETATRDGLSRGRLTLGVGLGGDRFASELSMTGEELDDRRLAEMLDETLAPIRPPSPPRAPLGAWSSSSRMRSPWLTCAGCFARAPLPFRETLSRGWPQSSRDHPRSGNQRVRYPMTCLTRGARPLA